MFLLLDAADAPSFEKSSYIIQTYNIKYKEGEYIVVIKDKILFAETTLIESVSKTISYMSPDQDSLITLYWGEHSKEKINKIESQLIEQFNSIDMEFQYGGQSNIEAWVAIE